MAFRFRVNRRQDTGRTDRHVTTQCELL